MANPSLDFAVASNFGLWARFCGALYVSSSTVEISGTAAVVTAASGFLTVRANTTPPAPQRTRAVRPLVRTGNVL